MNEKISNLPLPKLRDMAASLMGAIADCEAEMKQIESEILRRYRGTLEKVLAERKQEHGEATFEVEDVKLKLGISKTVSWDSDKLKEIAADLDPELQATLFNVKITIPERKWDEVSTTPVGKTLATARTVKYGEPKVKIE
jgi:hypothetical protein